MIDLHVHTTMSDGTVSPREVVRLASRVGLRAVAITDHDTVRALPEAQSEGALAGVEVVSGVEISAQWPTGILHILGYFVNRRDERLLASLELLEKGRVERIPKILAKLLELDVVITGEEVRRAARGGVPGRPHIANVLLERGRVRTLQEAFDRYLRRGAPAYVEKVKLTPPDAVRVILEADGVPVIAHPHSLNSDDPARLERIVRDLMDMGIKGIEAYYPRHTPEQTKIYLDLAARLDLVATGGTDFHGANKPLIKLGVIPGQGPLPYSILQDLKRRKPGPWGGCHYAGG
ncbi:MAG: PHP domain-containing protein [Pseudomonadota bacterium]